MIYVSALYTGARKQHVHMKRGPNLITTKLHVSQTRIKWVRGILSTLNGLVHMTLTTKVLG